MRIFINGRFLAQSITGVQRYAIELVKEIDRNLETNQVEDEIWSVIAPQGTAPLKLRNIKFIQAGWLGGHAWEQIELPFYARGGMLINLCNTGPLLHHRQIVTIHDASVFAMPKAISRSFGAWHRFIQPRIGRRARVIVTVSIFSKNELIHFHGIKENKIHPVYHGSEHILASIPDQSVLHRNGLQAGSFVLSVSTLNPYKNFKAVLATAELLHRQGNAIQFVVAGGANPKVFKNMGISWPASARYIGRVNDGELRALYESAACFLFPSLYEGFGLPPVEAMVCGCPVIASNAASIPEVCGDAALYCDPKNPADIAAQVSRVLNDPVLRAQMIEKGRLRATELNWARCAAQTLELVREAIRL